jgi:hypothetical protein
MSEQIHILGGIFRDFIFYGKVHASSILEIPGGTGYNVYKGLIELGINVGFSGSVVQIGHLSLLERKSMLKLVFLWHVSHMVK